MTARQSRRALRRALLPVLEANGFTIDKKYEGVVATRDRGDFHDKVRALVTWTLPRSLRVVVSMHSDALNDFLKGFGGGRARETPHAICNLRTFEPGASPFPADGAGTDWEFDGDEPSETLLAQVSALLDVTLRRLDAIRDVDSTADLIRDHDFDLSSRRDSLSLAGAFAHAARFLEAARVCRAAMASDAVALAHRVTYNPQQRLAMQSILDYCESRSPATG